MASSFRFFFNPYTLVSQNPPPPNSIQKALHYALPETEPRAHSTKEKPLQCTVTKRRTLTLSILPLILPFSLPIANAVEEDKLILQEYADSKEGFRLLIPSSYVKVDKAGATVLFEEMNKGSNNVGIVVSPVRLTSLKDFGDPQFVADKLLQAEKRKESTKDVELIGVSERPKRGSGSEVYEFEYRLDSTRGGMKRIFSAAFVAQKKLYLLNIVHADKPESPLDVYTKSVLEQVLHSFDALPSS